MYKHKATMTDRRHQILFLIAKGYNNKQIAIPIPAALDAVFSA